MGPFEADGDGVSATLSIARTLSELSARFRSAAKATRRASTSRYASESMLASWALEATATGGLWSSGDTESDFF